MSKVIYIETTIPSFYHETRPRPELVAMRNWTRDWWQQAGAQHQFVTSDAVLAELDLTPEPKRTECIALTATLPILEDLPEIDETVEFYIRHKLMPASLEGDARHLALATWNCRHIANPNKLEHLHHIHDILGLHTPILATPFQLMEAEK